MWQELVIKHKKNSKVYNIDFVIFKHQEDLFKKERKTQLMKRIDFFWFFESFEKMKENLIKEISELYANNEIEETSCYFLIDNIKKYFEEKKNPNFNRVHWKKTKYGE